MGCPVANFKLGGNTCIIPGPADALPGPSAMNRLWDLLLFWFLLQVGNQGSHGHNDGKIGDIGFKCPSGSKFYQGYCLRKETVPMTWEDAKTACLRSGMYLAWLEDDIENEYVATQVMSEVNQYWIGLSNTSSTSGQNEVSWSRYRMSEDKTIPVYKGMWKNLQPADFMEENKCVSTLKDEYDNHWTVTNCRKKLPFVCKLMGAPKPHASSCSELKMLEKGTPGSITMTSFDNNAFCTWTIQAPVGDRIKITISSSFHLEENADVLSVWTGVADSLIWNDMKKLTAGSSWQNLESPLYGTAVPFGLQLEWLITAGSYQVVTLEFLEVDLPTSSSLQVYDGEDLMAPQVFTLNKTPMHPIYISRSKSVRVVLSTDEHEYTKYRGFQLKYKEGCNIEMKQQGTIYSPGYKVGSYPSNVTCAWILTRNTGEAKPISLRFTEFNVKSNSDYVEVYNDTAGTALHTGSGLTGTSDITEIFSSTDGYLNVTFKSNLVLVEKGFKAEFSVDCPMLTLSQWTVNSVTDKYTALNTEIELSCQPGYSFKQEEYNRESSVALKCLPGGKWNVSRIPDCQITYCSTPPAVQNGILKSATGGKVGDNATYECNGGFTLSGSPPIQCQENGVWEAKPSCNVIDCGTPEQVPGAEIYSYTDTLYGSSFNFSCLTGSVRSGVSVNEDYTVTCQENRRWGFGNLTCTVGRCTDPGTPGGAVQVVRSYEAGELLSFRCLRSGYEPVPSAPLMCQQDVTPPKFSNCLNVPFYVDKMEATDFVVPTASDNSGLVKNVTVMPYNFKPGTVVSEDVNVTYTAVDNSGNSATCTVSFIIKDRSPPELTCPKILEKTINTTIGIKVDLNESVTTGATFYPNQFITLNPSTLDGPRKTTLYKFREHIETLLSQKLMR
uniref:CUB and sushi domain-containing protein 1 n=1 Tax=Magallana gigas TaxID=29159 RepID=K1REE8_MAGGI